MSGRRVKGRVAIACDAVGALDAVAVTGTLASRGRWRTSRRELPGSLPDPRIRALVPGAPAAGRPPKAAARRRARPGAAERSGAALSTPGMGDRLGVKVPWRKR